MAERKAIKPYQNETDVMTIGEEFNIENRLDRVSIFGSIDLTKDKQGLAKAVALKSVVDSIVVALQTSDLSEGSGQNANISKGKNPFAD